MFLKKCDFLSPNIHLYFKGKRKHSSLISGILSIILAIITIIISIIFSKDFLLRKNPNSSFYKKYIDDVKYIPFDSSGLFHYITFNTISGLIVNLDKKALTIIGLDVNDEDFLSNSNLSEFNFWIYEVCDESDIGELIEFLDTNGTINYYKSYCIHKYYDKEKKSILSKNDSEFKYPFLEHGNSRFDNAIYGTYLLKCQNFTILNNNSCYSISKINQVNDELFNYAINFLEYSVDVHNYKEPLIPFFHRIQNEFSKNSFTFNHLNFKQILLNSNVGYISNRHKEMLGFEFYQNEKLTEYETNEENIKILGSFNFWMSNEIGIYERKYLKIQDVAGGISGIIRILYLLFEYINITFLYFFNIANDFNEEFYRRNIKEKMKSNSFNHDTSKTRIIGSKNEFLRNINSHYIYNQRSSVKNKVINFKIPLKRKIKWFYSFFGYNLQLCKNDIYVQFILNIRKSLLSEERIIKQFYILKTIKQYNILLSKSKKYQSKTQISNNEVFSYI